jgi:hypothetical protein
MDRTARNCNSESDETTLLERIGREFDKTASHVFKQFRNPHSEALLDAMMMWLAWRGDERYVQVHLSYDDRSSSWRFCEYESVPILIRKFKHVEVRPINPPFPDYLLAFFSIILRDQVNDNGETKIRSRRFGPDSTGFSERPIDVSEIFGCAREGCVIYADWPSSDGVLLKKSINLSRDFFYYLDYEGRSHPAAGEKGFIYILKKKDASGARRRRKDVLRWVRRG